jgi:hypothetical protein
MSKPFDPERLPVILPYRDPPSDSLDMNNPARRRGPTYVPSYADAVAVIADHRTKMGPEARRLVALLFGVDEDDVAADVGYE